MTETPIPFKPAKNLHEMFENQAIHKALEFVFRERTEEFKHHVTEEEFSVLARAYWHLAVRFSETWGVKERVMPASTENPRSIYSRVSNAVYSLFRRVVAWDSVVILYYEQPITFKVATFYRMRAFFSFHKV